MPAQKQPWNRLDLDHGLARGLGVQALFLFDESSGHLRDLISGSAGPLTSGTETTGLAGRQLTFNGTTQATNLAVWLPDPAAGTSLAARRTGFTVLARFRVGANASNNPAGMFGIYAASGTQGGFGVGWSTSAQVGAQELSGAGAGMGAYSAGAVGSTYTVAAYSSGNNSFAWINGQPATTNQGVATASQGGGSGLLNEISVGGQHRSSGFLRYANGDIEWGAVLYGVEMTDALAWHLYADEFPYNLFRQRRIIVAPGAAGTPFSASPSAGAATVEGYAPSLAAGAATAPSAGAVTVEGYAPSLAAGAATAPSAGAVTVEGYAPSLAAGAATAPSAGAVTVEGYAPSLSAGASLSPAGGAVTVEGHTPSLAAGASLSPAGGAVTVEGHTPSLAAGSEVASAPGIGAVTVEGYAPSLAAEAATAPSAGAVTVEGYAPSLAAGVATAPSVGAVTVSGYAPSLAAGSGLFVEPGLGAVTVAGHAPVLATGTGALLSPSAGAIEVDGFAPALSTGVSVEVTAAGDIIVEGYTATFASIVPPEFEAVISLIERPARRLTTTEAPAHRITIRGFPS